MGFLFASCTTDIHIWIFDIDINIKLGFLFASCTTDQCLSCLIFFGKPPVPQIHFCLKKDIHCNNDVFDDDKRNDGENEEFDDDKKVTLTIRLKSDISGKVPHLQIQHQCKKRVRMKLLIKSYFILL